MVSGLLVLTLACRGGDPPVVRVQQRTEAREPRQTVRQKTTDTTTTKQEQEKTEKTLAPRQKPAQEFTREQKVVEPNEAPPTRAVTSDLMSRLKGERAATAEEVAAEEELMDEITGLIMEQTMTKIGYEFYEYFFLLWEPPQEVGVKDYNIFIREMASPVWGSWVSVSVNGATIWNKVLRPRSAEVEDSAKEAIVVTQQYLYNYQQYQFQSEDLVGTGI
jgi:hypothetical protein